MKHISLVALTATAAMAQLPAVTAPAAAPAASYATAGASTAPVAPVHDQLLEFNPAIEPSLAGIFQTPSEYAGQRAAVFQWDGGAASFHGVGMAVVDRFFVGFRNSLNPQNDSANIAGQGQIVGGYIAPRFGVGVALTLDRAGQTNDSTIPGRYITDSTGSSAVSGIGVFGSGGFQGLTVYGHLDWFTPMAYNTRTYNQGANLTNSTRADAFKIGVGARTAAMGDRGISWNASVDYAHYEYRADDQESDRTYPLHTIHQLGQIGKTISVDGFVLAGGLDEKIDYANGLGDAYDTALALAGNAPSHITGPDSWYRIALEPTLGVILPVFEHWTVKGGARIGLQYRNGDILRGDKVQSRTFLETTAPSGSVGVRYERGRWAAEAGISKAFLRSGPSFVSGDKDAGAMFYSFAMTANFK